MPPRRSPYRHKVKEHYRNGFLVRTYKRGEGDKPRIRSRPRRVVGSSKGDGDTPYNVTLFYPKKESQAFNVDSDNWTEAAREGFTRTKESGVPEKVRIRIV